MVPSSGADHPALLHEFFTRAAERWPQHVAVDVPPGALRPARHRTTYHDLDRQSDSIAHRLAPAVTGECVVAILLSRSTSHVYAAQLGVMKAGAAYTCCDPAFPDERLRQTLHDAGPVAVITDANGRTRALAAGIPAARIIDVVEHLHARPTAPPFPRPDWLTPANLAYVIYTSGTTGRPKGVMIEHRSIVNLVASDCDLFKLDEHDRCVQCSSPAYDSSVEETWLAFAVGATLVVMDEYDARLGPDIVPWLRRERISEWCPSPTLLRSAGCSDPASALPELEMLYLGGEALPQDLSDRWAGACALYNGYGPTECSVTTVRALMRPGVPVTIGMPVPNVQAWIVDDALEPVPDGTHGELVLGGIALSRGYWNQPELTAQRFPQHPTLGRIYRTGDVAHRQPDGHIVYHGRSDAQVKLRGYRIELGAIESALAGCQGVREAACAVQGDDGRQTLVAFVVADEGTAPDTESLQQALRASLPDYMVPAYIGVIEAIPTNISGKLDRKALPRLDGFATNGTHERANGDRVAPRDPVERKIEAAMRRVLRRNEPLCIHDDFFLTLGGDSLGAAELVTTLRDDPDTDALDVRDVYDGRTIEHLAERARAGARGTAIAGEARSRDDVPLVRTTLLQVAWLLQRLVIGSAIAWAVIFRVIPALLRTIGLHRLLLAGPALFVLLATLYVPVAVALAVISKRSLIGRYERGRSPVWGTLYLRHWIVQQSVKSIPWWVIEGTEFQVMALRALGARIGQRVHLHRGVNLRNGAWDLIDIGDDVTLSQDVSLRVVELEDGEIVFSPITIGAGATLEVHAGVGGDCVLEPGAYLAASSSLPRGTRVPRGERWAGIPAKPAGSAPAVPAIADTAPSWSPLRMSVAMVATRLALSLTIALPGSALAVLTGRALGIHTAQMLLWWAEPTMDWRLITTWLVASFASVPLALAIQGALCRAMGRVGEGVSNRWSASYLRIWLKPLIVDNAGRWLYGTLFWPSWLRLAGMKLGAGCEISGLIDTIPELVSIGEKTFFADGIYLAGPRLHRGTVTVANTSLAANTFLGNGAIILGGQHLPEDVLLGVCTIADERTIRSGSAWFGNPPFELPHREVISYDPAFTYDPSPLRYTARVFWELMRFVVPVLPSLMVFAWFQFLVTGGIDEDPWLAIVAVPLLTLSMTAVFTALVVALKWALIGKVKPGMHPLWSSWASRWDLMCLAWNIFASDVVMALDGTILLNALLRTMGVTIGRRVVLGVGFAEDLPDPDMLTFEDGATVDCLFQAHTFEDRVLKTDRVTIRRGATVGHNAVLLYGAEVGERTRVAPHSVVLKHERLLPARVYAGFPTRPQEDAATG
ncbi:MAG: amino acid adenylation domain-containing protein [Proteobacteria bacterium]|nr:amino acid adenylation domain-containing protein [Pseudomonadota bacterium]